MSLMNAGSSASPASSPSRSSPRSAWWRWAALVRLGAGPLALGGFFLPWAHGPGVLSASEFSGFGLVGFAGRLQELDLTAAQGWAIWVIRLAILGVAVAGAWQTVLAPWHRRHVGYPVSGWYLVAAAVVCLGIGALRAGIEAPPSGIGLLAVAAVLYLVGIGATELSVRTRDLPPASGNE